MTKKLTAAILALLMCISLASCKMAVKERSEDFDFTELSGIPSADIKIAYIHAEDTSLERDLDEFVQEKLIVGDKFLKLDISSGESLDGFWDGLLSKGYNLFFLDGGLSEEFISTLPTEKGDVYFVSYGNTVAPSKNLISFKDDFLEYSYLLGVIAAESGDADSIGIITDSFEYCPEFNAFAAGVKLVNSNIKVIVSERVQTLAQNGCKAVFIPSSFKYKGNTELKKYGFKSSEEGSFLSADYSDFLESCIESVTDGSFSGGNVSLGARHGSMDQSLETLELSEELMEKVEAIKKYFVGGMPVFSANQLMISGGKVISVHEVLIDNRGNTVIDENGNYYYYSDDGLLLCESYEELVGEKMNYYLQNVELK